MDTGPCKQTFQPRAIASGRSRRYPRIAWRGTQSCLLALQLAKTIQLRLSDMAAGTDLELVNPWRVDGEDTLHPDAEAHLPDGEGLSDPAVRPWTLELELESRS